MRRRFHLRRLPAVVLAMTVFLGFAVPQSPAQKERPKLKDFGSSLDQLKWDPEKKAAVERVRPKETDTVSSEDDVIRTETDPEYYIISRNFYYAPSGVR